jgi:hypothetical protein
MATPGTAQASESQPNPEVIPPAPKPGSQPLPGPNLVDIIDKLADRADPLIKLLQASMDSYQKGVEREIRHSKHMSLMATALVVLIVIVAASLTYVGKIDGSTFTFLLGLIVGYVLTFVRDQITGPE